MKSQLILIVIFGILNFGVAGCFGESTSNASSFSEEAKEGYAHEAHEEDEESIKLSPKEVEEFKITTAKATRGSFENIISVSGEVILNKDQVAHVTSRVSGFTRLINKTLGDRVEKGELLAVIDSAELAQSMSDYDFALTQLKISESQKKISTFNHERQKSLHDNVTELLSRLKKGDSLESIENAFEGKTLGENRSKLLKAYSELSLTQSAFERENELRKKKISSESDFLNAKNAYEGAKSEFRATFDEVSFQNQLQFIQSEQVLEQAKQGVQAAQQSIRASEAKLRSFAFSQAELKQLQRDLPTKTDTGRYELRSPISGIILERYITLGEGLGEDDKLFVIANFDSVWVNLTLYEKDLASIKVGQPVFISTKEENLFVENVLIHTISPILDPKTRTTSARLILPNPEGLWKPGLFIYGKIDVSNQEEPLVVPQTALQTLEEQTVLFIQDEEGFRPTPVKTGRENNHQIEILSGLKTGQRYVTKGAFTLKAHLSKSNFGGDDD